MKELIEKLELLKKDGNEIFENGCPIGDPQPDDLIDMYSRAIEKLAAEVLSILSDEKKLDLPKAAQLTRNMLTGSGHMWAHEPGDKLGSQHLINLLDQIIEEDVVGAQADRMLGWVQYGICMHTPIKQNAFAVINRECRLN